MLTSAQRRLLRLLARHPPEVEQAWDVPRELSLPGLAEAMGVVRSALHQPLQGLLNEGLAAMRLAHVLGGGSRRRQVYHVTADGRREAEIIGEEEEDLAAAATSTGDGEVRGDAPAVVALKGRAADLEAGAAALEDGLAFYTGVAGIGTSAALRALAERVAETGRVVHWAEVGPLDGRDALLQQWSGVDEVPKDRAVATGWLRERIGDGVLALDQLHEVHGRHAAEVIHLLEDLRAASTPLMVAARAPGPWSVEGALRLGELDVDAAKELLDPALSAERQTEVVEALGGHPQALLLVDPDSALPESGDDLRRFLAEQVLEGLSAGELETLDWLAATVLPVEPAELPSNDGIETLDERALLRWTGTTARLIDMVRNVRRAAWDEATQARLHRAATDHWSRRGTTDGRLLALHHRLQIGDKDAAARARAELPHLLEFRSDAVASLLDDGLRVRPDDVALRLVATDVALERGEREQAEALLEAVPAEAPDAAAARARLARLAGHHDEAEAHLRQAWDGLPAADRLREAVSEVSRRLDDRLPGPPDAGRAATLEATLEALDLSALPNDPDARRVGLVAIASLRHALALERGDHAAAGDLREQLADLASSDDPLVRELALRAELAQHEPSSPGEAARLDALRRGLADARSPLRREALRLQLIQRLVGAKQLEAAADLLSSSADDLPPPTTRAARRLRALRWWWLGVTDPGQRLAAWREAQFRLRAAECPEAAKEVAARLMRAL